MGSRLEENSKAVRKRIENHTFENEDGEEYKGSTFGGFSDYFRRKKIKLQNLDFELRALSTDNPPIFRGIVAHVNGYTQPSLNDLHHLIVSHGGGFMQYLDGKTTVTHIIASNLTPKKVVEFRRYRIVKPAWVVESVNAGKLMPWDTFRVVDEGNSQKILQLDNDSSWYTSQIFKEGEVLDLQSSKTFPQSNRANFMDPPSKPATPRAESDNPLSHSHDEEFMQCNDNGFEATGGADNDLDANRLDTTDNGSSQEEMTFECEDEPALAPLEKDSKVKPPTPDYRHLAADMGNRDIYADGNDGDIAATSRMTAEEHNAALLSDPQIRKLSTLNPGFLEQYYRESRLHHLSMWKADLKSQLQALTVEKSASQKARQKRASSCRRYILHVDFDSFFVAVSLKKNPEHVNKPVAVAHGSGGGSEIASCNYPARKYGVKNGMWMKRALELCPDIKVLPYDFPAYEEASKSFYEAVLSTGGVVQSVSIDEALVDVTSFCHEAGGTNGVIFTEDAVLAEQAKAEDIAQNIRDRVEVDTGCRVSIGIGGNILLAKCALRKAKPAGQYQVKPEEVLDFLAPLEVQALPGVAWSIGGRLEELGIKFVRDIRKTSKEKLVSSLGPKTGEKLWNYARGIDRTEVGEQVVRKSVSAEVNWGVRFETQEQAEEFLESLCGELNKRLLKEQVKGRQLTMKIMKRAADAPRDPPKHLGHGRCDTFNKSIILGVATNDRGILTKEAVTILRGYGFSPGELRGLGVQMQKLESIKGVGGGRPISSQMRLHFKAENSKPPIEQEDNDPIEDNIKTPKKSKHPIGIFATDPYSPSQKPLNTMGTQFLLPTQVDHGVLDELPQEVRNRLARRVHQIATVTDQQEPIPSKSDFGLPNESQLDPDILEALPNDVRSEIEAYYRASPHKQQLQFVLPQSPSKIRSVRDSKKSLTARARPRAKFLSRLRGASRSDTPTLTQANFVTTTRPSSRHSNEDLTPQSVEVPGEAGATVPDLEPDINVSPEFLAALPDDIRREVLDHQLRERLRRKVGLDLANRNDVRRRRQPYPSDNSTKQRLLKLPPRPPKPTFTTNKLSTMPDLREAMSAWIREFEHEGPYQEDVEALITYLKLVVLEERDMSKAVQVVRWMEWVVEHYSEKKFSIGESPGQDMARAEWLSAINRVKDSVRTSVQARGLGQVDF